MTDAQKHAARLREQVAQREKLAEKYDKTGLIEHAAMLLEPIPSLLAGASALEAQGRWRAGYYAGRNYLIPVGREDEWQAWCDNRETGEYTAIVPDWAEPVPDNVVITGWERP